MARADTTHAALRDRRRRATVETLSRVLTAQRADVLDRLRAGSPVLLPRVWNGRLRDAIYEANRATAREIGMRVAKDLTGQRADFEPDVMDAWLLEQASATAELYNASTEEALAEAAEGPEEPEEGEPEVAPAVAIAAAVGSVLDAANGYRLTQFSSGLVSVSAAFGSSEAAKVSGGDDMVKEWKTNSSNPRSSHRRIHRETVPYGKKFSNGLRWPGDARNGSPEDVANCKCSVVFII